MDKTYQPQAIEKQWYQTWEDKGYFKPSGQGEPYCIMIPPPNVTGSLHMGHGFQEAIMDALIRYHRMLGYNTLWQVGTDHAGIATQMVVERQLEAEGISRHDLGREKFLEKVWEWKEQSGGTITRQLRRLGSSLDWSRERFTMDEGLSTTRCRKCSSACTEEGLIYRGKRLVNWDPVLHTAISDLEVISEEEQGQPVALQLPAGRRRGPSHWLPPPARRPCSATPLWRYTRKTSAIRPPDSGMVELLPCTGREIPGDRRRLRRPRVRYRLREDHPGPRLQRL